MVYCCYIVPVCFLWILLFTNGQLSQGGNNNDDVETVSIVQAILEGDAVLDDFYVRYATTPLVDLVFVLDRSGSVPPKGWGAIVNFLYDTLQHFTVDQDNTRVAVVTYSNDVTVDINDLDDPPHKESNYGNKCTLHSRIEALIESKIPYGYTATHDALDAAYRILVNSRPDAKKAVLVLTDGESNIGPPPVRATHNILSLEWNAKWNETAMGPQVEIYAFGIQDAFLPELNSIASPLPNHTFLIPTFEAFESFARKLHGGKQEETWINVSSADCQNSCGGAHVQCMCGARKGQYACVCDPGYERIGITCKACEKGYYKAGHTLSMCLPCPVNTTTDHTTSIRQEDCKLLPGLRDCPPIPTVDNGWPFFVAGTQKDEVPPSGKPCTDVRNGNSCHYKCEEGYWMQGSPIMHCNRSGLWEGIPPNCTLIDCGDPSALYSDLANTTLTLINGTATYNSVTEVTCLNGLVPIGRTTWKCDRHGKWTKPWNFLCAEIECPPLPRIAYSTSFPEACYRHRQRYGVNCTVECLQGFELVGGATVSCDFKRRALWDTQTQQWPWCRDIKPPVILCLDHLDLMVTEWQDNATFVHIEAQDALASDNSGNFTQWVTGVPPSELFKIGVTVITYHAKDSSGLTSRCERNINVKAKQVNIISCPHDVVAEMNSKDGMLDVKWDDPVFLDSMDKRLAFSCFPDGPFHVGNHSVKCIDTKFQVAKCQFNVVVTMPECPLPFSDQLPPNSAIICGEPPRQLYPKWCRVHCEIGYELRIMGQGSDHSFKCGWDGQWDGLDGGWPKCRRTRRPVTPKTIGEMHIAYEGNCEDEKRAISSGFIETVIAILTGPGRPCSGDVQCTVSDVEVYCGGTRKKKRSLGANDQGSIVFTISTWMANITEDTITAQQQQNLAYVLDDAFTWIEDHKTTLHFNINNITLNVSTIDTLNYTTFGDLNCSQLTEESTEYYSGCLSCSAGSYFVNETCIQCPPGTYQSISGAFNCEKCPQGTTSPTGAVSRCQCVTEFEATTEAPQNDTSTEPYIYIENNPCYLCKARTDNCTDEAPCEPYCQHGDCSKSSDWVTCECFPGYVGARCDVLVDVCYDVECFNGGTCIPCEDCADNYTCICVDSFTGEYCEALEQQCHQDTCLHGYCVDHHGNHSCICDDGWTGSNCYEMVTECGSQYCLHGDCTLASGRMMCHCHASYTGERCEYFDDPCGYINCDNDGFCLNINGEGRCQCQPGFTGDVCEVEVCSSFTCENNATCLLVGELPLCKCTAGFTGPHCDKETSADFDLVFSTGHIDDFVSLRLFNTELYELTACAWLRTQDVLHYGTIFSYAAQSNWLTTDDVDVFTLHNYGKLKLLVNGESRETDVALNDGFWHHLCVTWTQLQGQWAVYVNGSLRESGSNLAVETYIEPGGYFVIGQKQDTIGDGFSQRDTFTGEIHQLNVYSIRLSEEDISFIYKLQCDQKAGDVITWSHVIGHVTGEVAVRSRSWCLDVNECVFNACADTQLCEDQFQGFRCVADPCESVQCLNGGTCKSVIENGEQKAQCECTASYIGPTCNKQAPSASSCNITTPCLHGGVCSVNGSCSCPHGYTGSLCNESQSDPCISQPCPNGGSCLAIPTGSYQCSCVSPWTGSNCQTRLSGGSGTGCQPNPCLNNGQCIESPETEEGYACKCLNENTGYNCESNVCLTQPCHHGATCIVIGSTSFECICLLGFGGPYCDYVSSSTSTTSTAAMPTTMRDICHGVNCLNGGRCVSDPNGFKCRCTLEYYGPYCGESRAVHEYTYDIRVTLEEQYTPELERNETFKQEFVNVIHKVYQPDLKESKIQVVIQKISKGSIVVDFQIIHTNYTGAESPSAGMMEKILTKQLMTGKLGPWKTDVEHYQFEEQIGTKAASPTVWLTCVIVVLVLVLVCIVGCICYRKRRLHTTKPVRMNNLPDKVQFRIRNNMQASGKAPPSPTVQIRMGSGNEDVYSEPYSISPGDQTNDVGARFPSKRGLDINHTWGSRQSVPLPPPPDEHPPRRRTPPPPYSKSMKVDNANINPTETNKCSPREIVYITPLAEEDIANTMAKPDIEQQYLTPKTVPRPLNREEIQNLENEDIYLHPRTDGQEVEEKKDEEEEDAYLMPQSVVVDSGGDKFIPSDHESEDEQVAAHSRVYANEAMFEK